MRNRSFLVLLLASAACTTAPSPRPGVSPPPTPTATRVVETPTPVATPVATPVPTVPPPGVMPARDVDPPLVRVLLNRSSSAVDLPQPGRAYRLQAAEGAFWLWGPLSLQVASSGSPWWQVGAWAEPATADSVAGTLRRELGAAVEIRQEPTGTGLIRVQVRWRSGEPKEPAARLAALGLDGAFPVAASGQLRIEGAERQIVETSGEVVIEPAGDWPVAVGTRRYRGRLRVRVVGGETLVINELNLESYLRGVVPVEMGPSQFPQLDALKAQAVAARTYAVAHLGDHEDEGWDLCATPACQVYHGAGAEHRLSDRAVEETASLVAVYEGEPIDAMYTSTCGGHTENSSELFSGRAQPYLHGVACAWERPLSLVGTGPELSWTESASFQASVALAVLGLEPQASPGEILRAVQERTRNTRSLPAPVDAETFASSLLNAAGVDAGPGITPAGTGLERLLFLTDLYRAPLDPPTSGLEGAWPAAAALAALELRGDVVRDRGEAVPRPGGVGIFPRRAEHGEDLPSPVPLWERWRGGYRRLASTEVLPGTELERVRAADEVVALVVRRSGGGGEADRRSAWREWVRERSWGELERGLGMPELEKLQVTRRSPSGRVVGLEAVGRSGSRKQWTGFDVRRALDLPETLFSMHVRTRADGERVVHFLGRGWGHGVGLCQNGAYGLARSGRTFDQILEHYYTGIQIIKWQPSSGHLQSTLR